MTAPKFSESSNVPESLKTGQSEVNASNRTPEEEVPSTQQSRYRNLILIAGALLVLGTGWLGWNLLILSQKSNDPSKSAASPFPPSPVKLTKVETATLSDSLEVVGTLEASGSVVLRAEVSGRINQILVREGDRVQRGQIIARLDSEDLQAQLLQAKAAQERAKARLAELEAGNRSEDIAQAKANLKETEARLANAKEGGSPEGVAQAQAQLEAAKAEADLAQERVKRYRSLEKEGAISADRFQEYLKAERSTLAAVQEAERRLTQRQKERQYQIDELAATVEEAKQSYQEIENGSRPEEIAQARAQVAEAIASVRQTEVRIEKTRILAPFTGTVGDIPVKIGDYVTQGAELSTLTENDSLEVNLPIPVERSSDLRLGLPVEILDQQGATLTTGKISFVSPNVSANAQLIQAKATFSNVSGKLRNRQLVKARVIWDRRPGLLVPATAIARIGGENFIFVAETAKTDKPQSGTPQMVARQKVVKLGNLQGNSYQVLDGLKPGESIITTGILNLRDGAPIMPEK